MSKASKPHYNISPLPWKQLGDEGEAQTALVDNYNHWVADFNKGGHAKEKAIANVKFVLNLIRLCERSRNALQHLEGQSTAGLGDEIDDLRRELIKIFGHGHFDFSITE